MISSNNSAHIPTRVAMSVVARAEPVFLPILTTPTSSTATAAKKVSIIMALYRIMPL